MPSINSENNGSRSWYKYLAYGCGGCLILCLIIGCIIYGVMWHAVMQTINTISNPSKPPKLGSYKTYRFDSLSASSCSIPLPDGSGSITYMQDMNTGGGSRAIRINTAKCKKAERPLASYASDKIRVGFYWYPQKSGKGPYIRMYDITGEQIIDLQKVVTRRTLRFGNNIYAGDEYEEYNGSSYSTSKTDSKGNITEVTNVEINGRPADDVTAIFGKDKGIYMGSIVSTGNKLTWQPAPQKLLNK